LRARSPVYAGKNSEEGFENSGIIFLRTISLLTKKQIHKYSKPRFYMKPTTVKLATQKLPLPKRIKVKLDYRTTIIINRQSSLKIWKKIFPFAKVVS